MFHLRYSKAGCIDLTALDGEGRTLALYAIEKRSASCLKVSSIHSCHDFTNHSLPYLQVLLDASPALLTLPGREGSIPLHCAALRGTTDCLCVLLDYAPPKNSPVQLDLNQTDHSLWTPLHYAVAYYRLETAAMLIGRGGRMDMEDSEGKTAADRAESLEEGKEEMLAVLRGRARQPQWISGTLSNQEYWKQWFLVWRSKKWDWGFLQKS